ncbi:unnamed protein product, partial [Rotaria sp. Silwood1]
MAFNTTKSHEPNPKKHSTTDPVHLLSDVDESNFDRPRSVHRTLPVDPSKFEHEKSHDESSLSQRYLPTDVISSTGNDDLTPDITP